MGINCNKHSQTSSLTSYTQIACKKDLNNLRKYRELRLSNCLEFEFGQGRGLNNPINTLFLFSRVNSEIGYGVDKTA